jgi:hypothetical protein
MKSLNNNGAFLVIKSVNTKAENSIIKQAIIMKISFVTK